jgi:LmbE family N-acetylglucosaminyl deacetylase
MVGNDKDRIMSIFAHQDDETFSAGGTLGKYKNGYAVSVTSDPKRKEEFENACDILGINGILLENSEITVNNTQGIKQQLVNIIRQIRPKIVITHIAFDYHQEHRLVRTTVEEAVEWASHDTSDSEAHQVMSLWGAETTVLIPTPHILIDISSTNSKRLDAIKCYESQSHKGGNAFYSRFHKTRTSLRGIQAGVEHAEAFLQIPISLTGSFKSQKHYDLLP